MQEPLNVAYTWGESVNEPNTFHFQEQFMGEEGFVAHTQAPHFDVWKQFADAEVTNSSIYVLLNSCCNLCRHMYHRHMYHIIYSFPPVTIR